MEALAKFVTSPQGTLYGRACERFGVDPGASIGDPVLAHNMRVAYMLADRPDPETQDAAKLDADLAAIRDFQNGVVR